MNLRKLSLVVALIALPSFTFYLGSQYNKTEPLDFDKLAKWYDKYNASYQKEKAKERAINQAYAEAEAKDREMEREEYRRFRKQDREHIEELQAEIRRLKAGK